MHFNLKNIALSLNLVLMAGVSQAHVGFDNDQAVQGSYKRFALKVPHGCGTLATNAITIHIPEGIQGAKPMPKADWTTSSHTAKLSTPYDNHNAQITEDVDAVTWSNGTLPGHFYDEFVFQAKVAAHAGTMHFSVDQNCAQETIHWDAPSHDAAHPAATLQITEQATDAGNAHQH